jgi:hypothetical protein
MLMLNSKALLQLLRVGLINRYVSLPLLLLTDNNIDVVVCVFIFSMVVMLLSSLMDPVPMILTMMLQPCITSGLARLPQLVLTAVD